MLVTVTLAGIAINVTYLQEQKYSSGGQEIKQGIRTGELNATTTDSGLTEFCAHTYPQNGTDIRELRIHWETPRHNYTLSPVFTHDADSISGRQFSMQVIRDRDGSLPHANSGGDYVRITVRPRTFLSEDESALDPVRITIDAPGIYRERIILRNLTGAVEISRPAELVTPTPTEEPWPNHRDAREQMHSDRRTATALANPSNRSVLQ